jgi:hypothetical protein
LFEEFRYRSQLRKIRRLMALTLAEDRKKTKEARAEGRGLADMESFIHDEDHHKREFRDWIGVVQTTHLVRQADGLGVPIPNTLTESDKWQETWDADEYLTVAAAAELRTAIRDERKGRQEIWHSWITLAVSLITTATGLLGAAIGLMAYWATHSAK